MLRTHKARQTASSRFGPVLRLHHTRPYAGVHNCTAVRYGRADCEISGPEHIFYYPKNVYMYDSSHFLLSSFAHVNAVPNLNFLCLLLLLNSSHIHLAPPQ